VALSGKYFSAESTDISSFSVEPPQPSLGSQMSDGAFSITTERATSATEGAPVSDQQLDHGQGISPLGAFDSSDGDAIPTLTKSIAGITDAEDAVNDGFEGIPPDPMLAVGPDHVVTVVNNSYEIHDKNGNQLASEAFNSFFVGQALIGNPFDPKVRYDQYRDRFVIVVLDGKSSTTNQSQILIAVSDDSNPVGTWHKTTINSVVDIGGTNHWADYPGLGMDADALFITNNMFEFNVDGGDFGGERLWIVNKDSFYDGGMLVSTIHDPWTEVGRGDLAGTSIPSHAFGNLPSPIGTFLIQFSGIHNGFSSFLGVIRVTNALATPAFALTFIDMGSIDVITTPSTPLPGAPQLGSSALIATNDRRALDVTWRNGNLWTTFTVAPVSGPDTGQATAHWVRISTPSLDVMSLADQGNAGGNDIHSSAHTFFPSISVDADDNMALSFALSSSNTFAGAYFSGRLAGDPAGTTRNTGVIHAGSATYDPMNIGFTRPRWGDYSGISLDPSNEAEFWAFNEYARATDRWGTHIGRFSFADTPSSPQSVSATIDGALAKATITWAAPVDDGGLPVTQFVVLSTPDSLSTTTSATSTQASISGLTSGVSYTFTVTPSNNQGVGATSSPSNSITASTVPGPPTSVNASEGVNSAAVSWTAPASDGGSAMTGYTATSNPGGFTAAVGGSTLVANVTGLTNGVSYTFTVIATNAIGDSVTSTPSNAIVPSDGPGAPINVNAVGGDTQASVIWMAPVDDGGSSINMYTVTSSPGGVIATSTATSTTVAGLNNGTTYTFTVVATNSNGDGPASSPSNAVLVAAVPDAPTELTATEDVNSASVSWMAPADDGGSAIIDYTVTSNPGGVATTTSATTAVVSRLDPDTTYTFTVVARNIVGTSSASAASASTTTHSVPDAPTGVIATEGVNSASVSWTAPADDGGSAIIDYTVTSNPGDVATTTSATTAVVSGLDPDTTYTFTVVARNIVGTSSASAASASTTTHSVPDAPNGLTAVAKVESADVTWATSTDDGGSAITLYTVISAPEGIIATTTATSTTVNGLTNGTSYTFSVVATNAVGSSTSSASSTPVVPGPSLVFDPELLVLVNVGESATTTIVAQAVDTSTDRVIVTLQVPAELTVSAIACGGIFTGAVATSSTSSNSAFIECSLSGPVSTTTGIAIELTVTRIATSTATITFKMGATSTAFFVGGAITPPVVTRELVATEGVNVSGNAVTLDGVTINTAAFTAIAPTVVVATCADAALGNFTLSVAVDTIDGSFLLPNVPAGIHTLCAFAPGFVAAEQTGVDTTSGDVVLSAAPILKPGFVNSDTFINLTDILITINAFGTSGATRPDGNGNFTDVNADTFVNLTDILRVIGNFGQSGYQTWN
jgi:hypothetical protein